jgi:hypothetical protein
VSRSPLCSSPTPFRRTSTRHSSASSARHLPPAHPVSRSNVHRPAFVSPCSWMRCCRARTETPPQYPSSLRYPSHQRRFVHCVCVIGMPTHEIPGNSPLTLSILRLQPIVLCRSRRHGSPRKFRLFVSLTLCHQLTRSQVNRISDTLASINLRHRSAPPTHPFSTVGYLAFVSICFWSAVNVKAALKPRPSPNHLWSPIMSSRLV